MTKAEWAAARKKFGTHDRNTLLALGALACDCSLPATRFYSGSKDPVCERCWSIKIEDCHSTKLVPEIRASKEPTIWERDALEIPFNPYDWRK